MKPSPATRPHILHLVTELGTGGAELVLARLLSSAPMAHFRSTVIALLPGGEVADLIEGAGVPVRSPGMTRGWSALMVLPRLIRMIRAAKPDLIQTWMYHSDFLGTVLSRSLRVPVIWNIRQSNLDPALNRRRTLAIARFCALLSKRWPSAIVCGSRAAYNSHVAFGYSPARMRIIGNGFDTSRFAPLDEVRHQVRHELGVGPAVALVGWVGRNHPQKAPDVFLAVAKRLAADSSSVRFVVCGEGLGPGTDFSAAVAAAGLADRVHLLGRRRDIPRILNGLDLYVHPSRGEGFPNAIGEAMATAVPVVATDVGDSALLIGDPSRVVSSEDSAALAGVARRVLMMSPWERRELGRLARDRIRASYSLGSVARQYERLYVKHLRGGSERGWPKASEVLH